MNLGIIIFLFLNFSLLEAKSAVTYALSGGRLGDNLLAYCHAKWISYKYKIPLFYMPFEYSDQLMMHTKEIPLLGLSKNNFSLIMDICQSLYVSIDPNANILYIIPYFPESIEEANSLRHEFYFPIDWHNQEFKEGLKKMICPSYFFEMPAIPSDSISVALHVRIGTGFDVAGLKEFYNSLSLGSILKFPPLSYYKEQTQKIINFYPNQKIYIHLFTDHDNPEELIDIIAQDINDARITFGYRKYCNKHNLNVLEDFFAITKFDCLIRPDANFSLVASKLGDYKIQISPMHGKKLNEEFIIDQVFIEMKNA